MRDRLTNGNAKFDSPQLQHGLAMMEMSIAGVLDPPPAPEAPRVLVADDDPLTSEMLASIAEKGGYRVVSVRDGRDAFRMLRTDADFKVAIFNMAMPNLEGLDLVRYMKTEKRLMRIPVVVVSGQQGLKVISDSFAAGATMFLPKPFSSDQLQRTLNIAMSSQPSAKKSDVRLKHAA